MLDFANQYWGWLAAYAFVGLSLFFAGLTGDRDRDKLGCGFLVCAAALFVALWPPMIVGGLLARQAK